MKNIPRRFGKLVLRCVDMQKKKNANSLGKKKQGPFGSLAMRVLFISFGFIVLPLIFYAVVLYREDYNQKFDEIFIDLEMSQQDYIKYLRQFERNNISIIDLIDQFSQAAGSEKKVFASPKLKATLIDYAKNQNLSGICFLELTQEGRLICEASTNPLYVGQDFSMHINLAEKEKSKETVFIAKDPILGWNLYFFRFLYDDAGKIRGALASVMALDVLTGILAENRSWKNAAISVLDAQLRVLESSSDKLLQVEFFTGHRQDIFEKTRLIPVEIIAGGFIFRLEGKKRFAVISRIPETNAYLMLSIPSAYLLTQIFDYILRLAIFLVFIVLIGGIISYLLTLRMAKPMKKLYLVMTEVGRGHFDKRYSYDRFGFEINYLGRRFNSMTDALEEHIEKAKKEEAEKEVYAKELQIANQIQKSILPKANISLDKLDIAAFYKAAKEVAGDFYDWLETKDQVMITIADGVGKGISSCLYSFDMRSILRSFAMIETDLKKLVYETNEMFRQDTKESFNFVTAFVTLFDPKTGTLRYANCGHLPTFVKRKTGEMEEIMTKGTAFGVEEFTDIEVQEIKLTEGDFVVLYTDGVTEAQDAKEKFYKKERLASIIAKTKATSSEELIDEIAKDVTDFVGDAPQSDDITLLVMRVQGGSS